MSNTIDQIEKALVAAASAAPSLTFTKFPDAETAHGGVRETTTWAEWVQRRSAAARLPWPNADDLGRQLTRIEAEQEGDEAAEAWKAAIKTAKIDLPVEVGAALTEGRRTDASVEAVGWLFIDVDGVNDVEDVRRLHGLLEAAGVNHLVTESPTSRMLQADGSARGLRVHLYVQIEPVLLPTATAVPRRDVKGWWRRLFAAAAAALTGAVGLVHDASVDDLAQSCFVAHTPYGSDQRKMMSRRDGCALDVEKFVAALGQPVPRPGVVEAPPPPPRAPGAATASEPAPPSVAAQPSAGPTAGHTTGSLIAFAARYFGLLTDASGREHCRDRAAGKWLCRCPWADSHASDPRQSQGHLDDSTVIYDRVSAGGEDGGFECKHNGSGLPGECSRATAADVLRWARKRGCPLPDRPNFGGASAEAGASQEPDGAAATAPQSGTTTRRRDPRPRIVVRRDDLAGMRDAAIAALRGRADVFVRDNQLVDLSTEGPRPIPQEHLAAVLGEVAKWVTQSRTEDGEVVDKPAEVPRNVIGAVLKAPPSKWIGIKQLRAVVKHPPLLPDGRIVTAPGYDAESRLLYLPDEDINVPARPSREDAVAAKDRLLWFVRHTSFCDERGPSVWLAFLLTLAARTAVPTVPIVGFDAAVAGAGKTSLVKSAFGLVFGELPQLGAPVVDDDAEAEKRMPIWSRTPLVVWDNVKHLFGSPVVDGAVTAGKATVRKLGVNESYTLDMTMTSWAMTGNNLSVGDDAASRCLIARIKAPTSRRYDFAVDDVAFYRAQRPRAVADAMTILRAFVLAGSPQREDVPYCRFVEWSRLIRQALLWLGMPDPIGGEVVDSAAEAKATAMRTIAAWRRSLAEDASPYDPFHSADLDTTFVRSRNEDDDAFRRRRAVVDALKAVYGRSVEGAAKVGHALQKLRDATAPLSNGSGVVRFVIDKINNKSVYRLVVEAA